MDKKRLLKLAGMINESAADEPTKDIKVPEAKEGFKVAMEKETVDNKNYRKVLFTTRDTQLVLMSVPPGEEIGMEKHSGSQFLRFESGEGKAVMGDKEVNIKDGDAVLIPHNMDHNIINTSDTEDLKLYALYSPPQHKPGVVRKTKAEAESKPE